MARITLESLLNDDTDMFTTNEGSDHYDGDSYMSFEDEESEEKEESDDEDEKESEDDEDDSGGESESDDKEEDSEDEKDDKNDDDLVEEEGDGGASPLEETMNPVDSKTSDTGNLEGGPEASAEDGDLANQAVDPEAPAVYDTDKYPIPVMK